MRISDWSSDVCSSDLPRPPWSRSSGTWILKGARRHVWRLPRALATLRERPALATPSAVVPGPFPTTVTHLTPERLALATTPLSSRHSLPGPIALSVQYGVDGELPTPAAGEEANVTGHHHALTPMGPGNKSRDDICVVVGA